MISEFHGLKANTPTLAFRSLLMKKTIMLIAESPRISSAYFCKKGACSADHQPDVFDDTVHYL